MKTIRFVALDTEDNVMESWIQVLNREKIPFSTSLEKETKILITNYSCLNKEQVKFIEEGGVCFSQNLKSNTSLGIRQKESVIITKIHFPEYSIFDIDFPSIAYNYEVKNEIYTIGFFDVNERRIIKDNNPVGRLPIFRFIQLGKGLIVLSGIDFSHFYSSFGSTLRPISNRIQFTEVTERISQIDKGTIAYILLLILKKMFKIQKLPWIQVNYYPKSYKSVFMFRMDLDGDTSGKNIIKTAEICNKYGIKGTFYANKNLLQGNPENIRQLYEVSQKHDIGNHCDIHNVYDELEKNKVNIHNCDEWLHSLGIIPKGFVAPRGIWNINLDYAIKQKGYKYSSDFGIGFNDLPFRPYYDGNFSQVLQIPVNPYCVGRAEVYKEENGKKELEDREVLDYYKSYFEEVNCKIGNGFMMIYGHPNGLGKRHDLLSKIFELVDKYECAKMSIQEFVDWWCYREKVKYDLMLSEKNELFIKTDGPKDLFRLSDDKIIWL